MPVYDGNFFPKLAGSIRSPPVLNKVPYIMGCNSTEGQGVINMPMLKNPDCPISKDTYEDDYKKSTGSNFCVSVEIEIYCNVTIKSRDAFQ